MWYLVLPHTLTVVVLSIILGPMETTLPLRSFVQTHLFTQTSENAGLGEVQLLALEGILRERPDAGVTVGGAGGARKIRVALAGRGKRGGARVLYYYVGQDDTIYLLLAYGKNVQENLTEAQKQIIKEMVARL